VSIKLGRREPTPERPFGFGQERYLWTFMAAVGMFLAGAIFAIGFGSVELAIGGGESEGYSSPTSSLRSPSSRRAAHGCGRSARCVEGRARRRSRC
jgi:hypothetical protein